MEEKQEEKKEIVETMDLWEKIQAVNEEIEGAKVSIKGKKYSLVNDRVKAFRKLFPQGAIIPELLSVDNGVCIFKVTIMDGWGRILAVGHSYEKENSSMINKTSYIENCETSALGRALGFLGIGVDQSIASAEEVATAIVNQENEINEQEYEEIETLVSVANVNKAATLEKYKVESFMMLNRKQYTALRNGLIKAIKEKIESEK